MSLAKNYAAVFKTLDSKKVLVYMKQKGHLRLLPQIVRILEREKVRPASITVTAKDDPRIVGGSYTLDGYTLTDRTYRTALVNLYQKLIS
ncbi:MAG: hypothetical protein AAB955_02205 [Patescibacteria group bacterium]